MAETTIVFPDVSLVDAVEALLPTLSLPASAEFRAEPAVDYPGQQVAIDLYAPTDDVLTTTVQTVRDALFHQFRIPTRTSSELDREILLHQPAWVRLACGTVWHRQHARDARPPTG